MIPVINSESKKTESLYLSTTCLYNNIYKLNEYLITVVTTTGLSCQWLFSLNVCRQISQLLTVRPFFGSDSPRFHLCGKCHVMNSTPFCLTKTQLTFFGQKRPKIKTAWFSKKKTAWFWASSSLLFHIFLCKLFSFPW